LKQRKQQIGNQCYSNLDFDGIGRFSIEISQGKVLFDLLKKRFYLPAAMINSHYYFQLHVKIVGKSDMSFGCLPFFMPT